MPTWPPRGVQVTSVVGETRASASCSVQTGTIGSFCDSMIQAGRAMRSRIGATLARA